MSRTSQELLAESLFHLKIAADYGTAGDMTDQLVSDAVCMRLSAGIDVLARLAPGIRDQLFGDDWPVMRGLRNRIVHGYLLVDPAIIDRTVEVDLPGIIRTIRNELDDNGA